LGGWASRAGAENKVKDNKTPGSQKFGSLYLYILPAVYLTVVLN